MSRFLRGGGNKVGRLTSFKNSYLGFASYIGNECNLPNTKIGKYCSIGNRVKLIGGAHPVDTNISTHPAFYAKKNVVGITYVEHDSFEEHKTVEDNYLLVISNDVWIGSDVRFLEGVSVGNGAVIAAGAMVTKNVPDYAVVGGVPAKIIKYRFDKELIDLLLSLKWWDMDESSLSEIAGDFSDPKEFFCKNSMYGEKDNGECK